MSRRRAAWVASPPWGGDWDLRTWPLLAHSRWGWALLGGAPLQGQIEVTLPDSLLETAL